MIITNSSIGMDSARKYTSACKDAYARSRSVTKYSAKDFSSSLGNLINNKDNKDDSTEKTEVTEKEKADSLLSNGEDSLNYLRGKFNEITVAKAAKPVKQEEDLKSAIRYTCINILLMLIFGKNGGMDEKNMLLKQLGIGDNWNGDISLGSGSIEYTRITDSFSFEHYEGEFEETKFNAKGVIKTADGRDIDLNLELSMSRSFERYTKEKGIYEQIQMNLVDPLVINLDNCAADMVDEKFYFDLDSDGKLDEMSRLAASSGFLALDLNGDGEINNGSELFGTKSGDGFKDLAQYDKDNNGWIDEADEVFDKLKIFCINDDGSTTQYSLKDKGIGAIYLGNKETEFTIAGRENNTNAMVRKTGVFLYESGAAGTVQHVDLNVELGA